MHTDFCANILKGTWFAFEVGRALCLLNKLVSIHSVLNWLVWDVIYKYVRRPIFINIRPGFGLASKLFGKTLWLLLVTLGVVCMVSDVFGESPHTSLTMQTTPRVTRSNLRVLSNSFLAIQNLDEYFWKSVVYTILPDL